MREVIFREKYGRNEMKKRFYLAFGYCRRAEVEKTQRESVRALARTCGYPPVGRIVSPGLRDGRDGLNVSMSSRYCCTRGDELGM